MTQVAAAFGVSRQAFYVADAAFEEQGVPGLLPRSRGPKRAHKCTEEILDFAERWRLGDSGEHDRSLMDAIQGRFGINIHPRSLDRALAKRKKKRRSKEDPQT